MSALSPILRSVEGGGLMFRCPGCDSPHLVHVGEGRGERWGWNGSATHPTFTPSVLVRTGRAVNPAFVREAGDPPEVCHSFVTNGAIAFLVDSTHALAGQTVPLAHWWTDDA